MVKTTAQLPSAKSELKFWESLNLACSVLEIGDGENLWKCSQLEIRHKCLLLVIHSAETIHHQRHHHYLHHHRYVLKIGSKSSHESMFLVTVMAYTRFWISVFNRVSVKTLHTHLLGQEKSNDFGIRTVWTYILSNPGRLWWKTWMSLKEVYSKVMQKSDTVFSQSLELQEDLIKLWE